MSKSWCGLYRGRVRDCSSTWTRILTFWTPLHPCRTIEQVRTLANPHQAVHVVYGRSLTPLRYLEFPMNEAPTDKIKKLPRISRPFATRCYQSNPRESPNSATNVISEAEAQRFVFCLPTLAFLERLFTVSANTALLTHVAKCTAH